MEPEPAASAWQRRFAKVLQHVHETIGLIDENGVVLDTSGLYKPILGYPSEFWASRSIFDLLHPDDAKVVMAMRESVLAQPGATFSGEFSVLAADGSYQPLMIHAANALDDPDVRAIIVTSRNISEEKALLAGLARARDEALAEVELRTRLVATVSHELRNPIHALTGMAELLATSELPPAAAGVAQTLQRTIDSLATVVDDLLDTSRLGAGAISLSPRPMSVRAVVDDVVALARLSVRSPDLVVAAEVAPDVPVAVLADPSRVRQLLINLVTNAVKFTSRGRVDVRARWVDDRLVFEVADTGVGIPLAEQALVFDAFNTATNAGDASGAGLGLTIVRQLAQLMGGTVTVDSREGAGSTFRVALRVEPAELPDAVPSDVAVFADGTTPVLVVEDDHVNQLLATSQLARLGLRAIVVGSGEEAVALLSRGEGPDLVLMDFLLPGMDGVDTTRRIRELERSTGRRAVVIGVTASAMASDRAAAAAAGMDDFLSKPVGLARLGAALARWLPDPTDAGGQPVDVAVLEALADDLGSSAVVVDLVRTFLDELHARRSGILAGAQAGDIARTRAAVHPLKSSARLLGAGELGTACQQLEAVTDPAELPAAVDEVHRTSSIAARWFQHWLSHPIT